MSEIWTSSPKFVVASLVWLLATGCTPVEDDPPDSGPPDLPEITIFDGGPFTEYDTTPTPPFTPATTVIIPELPPYSTDLIINEIMVSPVRDEPDWIELLATGDSAVDLWRFTLVDDNRDHVPEQLPYVTIEPGEHYVIPASRDPLEDGGFRLTFQLGRNDELTLAAREETIDSMSWSEDDILPSASFGRFPDGEDNLVALDPTPGEPNVEYEVILCDPTAETDTEDYVEGDVVTIRFSCLSGEPSSSFDLDLGLTPRGVVLDEETGELTWETTLDQGGRHDFTLNVYPREVFGVPPETTSVTVWVADALNNPDNIPVDPLTYLEEWGLPVFHLEPSGTITQTYIPAGVTFMGRDYDAEIKIRGAASTRYPKNHFTVRFGDENLDTDEFGMGEEEHIILISTFDDNSYVRQKMAYDLWAAIAEHWDAERLTPRTFFAVVYISGVYHGLYVAIDRIDDHFLREMGFTWDGNLYKSVNHDANFRRTNARGEPKRTLHDGWEKKEGEPGVWDDLDALTTFAADSDAATFMASAADWINVDDFMDWYIFVHYIVASDSAGKNAYLYNDPDDPEFRFCPWDMNHSYGQSWRTTHVGSDNAAEFRWNNAIFAHFLDHPETAEVLRGRVQTLVRDGPLNTEWFYARMAEYYELIEPSARRDWDYWGDTQLAYFSAWHTPDHGFDGEREYLYTWLEERAAWIDVRHSLE